MIRKIIHDKNTKVNEKNVKMNAKVIEDPPRLKSQALHNTINKSLSYFLKEHKSTDEFTHTSMTGGKWLIPDNKLSLFYELYAKELNNGTEYHLTEKHQPNHGPIIIDFDFKQICEHRQITNKHIKKIMIQITNVLRKTFKKSTDFTCLVLQRPKPYKKDNIYKDGLHIQFPFIVTDYTTQHILRNTCMHYIEPLLSNFKFTNTIEEIYDEAIIERNNWCLYGSTKKSIAKYEVIKIYNANKKIDDYELEDIIKLLSIRDKHNLSVHKKDFKEHFKEHWNKVITQKSPSVNNNNSNIIHDDVDVTCSQLEELLDVISSRRTDNYNDWIRMGYALFNTSKDYLSLWDNWSKSSSKYKMDICENQWNKMGTVNNPLTYKSICYWAKQDNPRLFKLWEEKHKRLDVIYSTNNKLDKSIVTLLNKYCLEIYNIKTEEWCEPEIIGSTHLFYHKEKIRINSIDKELSVRISSSRYNFIEILVYANNKSLYSTRITRTTGRLINKYYENLKRQLLDNKKKIKLPKSQIFRMKTINKNKYRTQLDNYNKKIKNINNLLKNQFEMLIKFEKKLWICETYNGLKVNRFEVDFAINPLKDTIKNNFYGMKYVKYNKRYMKSLPINSTISIKGVAGTGKSLQSAKYVKKLFAENPNYEFLAISGRRTLTADQKSKFTNEGIDISLYLDIENVEDYKKQKNLIITPDSLIHLMHNMRVQKKADILWLDEVSSLFNYITKCEYLCDKRQLIVRILKYYIKKCKYLVISDANIDDRVMESINKIRPLKDGIFIHNTMKTNDNTHLFVSNYKKTLDMLKKDIADGKKVYITCDTKNESNIINNILAQDTDKKLKIKLYTADSVKTEKDKMNQLKDFVNCNKVFTKYDIIISSPTICYGLDFNVKHFHKVYAFFHCSSVCCREAYQMLYRCRDLIDKEIIININPYEYKYKPTSMKIIAETLCSNNCIINNKKKVNYQEIDDGDDGDDEDKIIKLDINGFFTNLVIRSDQEQNISTNDFLGTLASYIRESGGIMYYEQPFQNISEEDKSLLISEIKLAKDEIKNNELDEISKGKMIHDKQNINKTTSINKLFCIKNHEHKNKYLFFLAHINADKNHKIDKFKKFMIYLRKSEHQDRHIKNEYDEIKTNTLIRYSDVDMLLKWLDVPSLFTKNAIIVKDSKLSDEIVDEFNKEKNRLEKTYSIRLRCEKDKKCLFKLLTSIVDRMGVKIIKRSYRIREEKSKKDKSKKQKSKKDKKRKQKMISDHTILVTYIELVVVKILNNIDLYDVDKLNNFLTIIDESNFIYSELHGFIGSIKKTLNNAITTNKINIYNDLFIDSDDDEDEINQSEKLGEELNYNIKNNDVNKFKQINNDHICVK